MKTINRPIVIIAIGYIIGIIYGLYFKTSIAFIISIIFLVLNLVKIKKILYKIIKKYFLLLAIPAIIGNIYILYVNKIFNNTYEKMNNIDEITAIVIGKKEEKEYFNKYIVKAKSTPIRNKKYIIYVRKGIQDLEYGDKIVFSGTYEEPETARNFRGFNYKEYLKTQKIYGTFKINKRINIIAKKQLNKFFLFTNKIKERIVSNTKEILEEDEAAIFLGLLLGEKDNIENNHLEYFKLSNMSHVLAVSGMHTGYLLLFLQQLLNGNNKKTKYVLIIIFLVFFMVLTSFTPSVVRAVLMTTIAILSKLFFRKNDFLTSIFLSLLIILIHNPYLIIDIGLLLSFSGTFGIVLFSKKIINRLEKIINKKLASTLGVSIAAQILIMPIIIFNFNLLSISFILSGIIILFLVVPIFIYGSANVLISFISIKLAKKASVFLSLMIKLVLVSARKISQIRNLNYIVKTPKTYIMIMYYLIIFISYFLFYLLKKEKLSLRRYEKTIINRIKAINKRRLISILIIVVLIIFLSEIIYSRSSKSLKIFFIDVGQGDSALIITPRGRNILIDGGEEGQILLPYLLDRGITKLDYIIISHFDNDHVGGLFQVIDKLKVKNILISRQQDATENYIKFKDVIKNKGIKVIYSGVETACDLHKLHIEKDVYIDILWPSNFQLAGNNTLNNNSVVAKLSYKGVSILFTGDIEEAAEKQILKKYKNNVEVLNSTILKVPHHGSKTSSTQEFLEAVNPKMVLIGVGKNNKFGHPDEDVVNRIKERGSTVYRTDQMGEIEINVNSNGKIKVKKFIK